MGVKFTINGIDIVADSAAEASAMLATIAEHNSKPKKLRPYRGVRMADLVAQVFADWARTNPGKGLTPERVAHIIERDHAEDFTGDIHINTLRQTLYAMRKAGQLAKAGYNVFIAA